MGSVPAALRSCRGALGAVLVVASLAISSSARADSRAELEKARAAYLARNYGEAEERLRVLVDPKTGLKEPALLSQSRMIFGAVLLAQGHRERAHAVFERLILDDPVFEPDPLSFPGDVVNAFIDERSRLQERLKTAAANAARLDAERRARDEAQRIARERWLERVKIMAQEDKTVVRSNRLVAFLPFGIGQFQNRQAALGWVFLGTEAALTLASAVTLPMYFYARDRAQEEQQTFDIDQKQKTYEDRANTIQALNLTIVGALALTMGVGILQANLAYVPERVETRKRELPPEARITPVITTLGAAGSAPTGVFVGLSGVAF